MLPTKLALPMDKRSDASAAAAAATGAHWQGPWLLSVDRQDVQSLEDNAWNAALARTLPELFVSLLRWIAKTGADASRGCATPAAGEDRARTGAVRSAVGRRTCDTRVR